ncbi:unnamed protein product [Phytophthora fragariaefolia]|uniref:Unnamed protein product n=1 Tax=Phytophthora fragariaefolia TaxID=1490495 RepID=A0A9W6Y531_9STRA|nr:unnamed protein product [Phytophthora fragariaefolia]
MAAGRVRNMLLFKYMRDPQMLSHIPAVKKMENRKAYLKKEPAGGWELNKFVSLQNWAVLKMCQDAETFLSADESNMAVMNAMIILDELSIHLPMAKRRLNQWGSLLPLERIS